MEWVMSDDLDKYCRSAAEAFLDRRSLIFIEEAIGHYIERHGVKKTRHYLKYMLDYLDEFETKEKDDV